MAELDTVDLSRLQFALTALYHFLFVPLTMGLSVLLAIMESVYVMTGRPIWRESTAGRWPVSRGTWCGKRCGVCGKCRIGRWGRWRRSIGTPWRSGRSPEALH